MLLNRVLDYYRSPPRYECLIPEDRVPCYDRGPLEATGPYFGRDPSQLETGWDQEQVPYRGNICN